MCLLGVAGDDGAEHGAQLLELEFGGRPEERQGGEVDSLGRVARVDGHGAAGRGGLAVVADADAAEQVLGVAEVRLLLGAAEALALLALGLVLAFLVVGFGLGAGALGQAVGDALGLGLLVGGGFGVGLGLGLGGLLCLFALDLGVFGGVPRV